MMKMDQKNKKDEIILQQLAPETKAAAGDGKEEEAAPPPEKIEDLQAELDGYIGLKAVKEEVRSLINLVTVYQLREKN